MQKTVTIDCPPEILLGLHFTAESFAEYLKQQAAINLLGKADYHQELLQHGWVSAMSLFLLWLLRQAQRCWMIRRMTLSEKLPCYDRIFQYHADWVIIDEKIGRNMAEYLGFRVTGTLGILLKAKQQGLIPSFTDGVKAMQAQGIYYQTTS